MHVWSQSPLIVILFDYVRGIAVACGVGDVPAGERARDNQSCHARPRQTDKIRTMAITSIGERRLVWVLASTAHGARRCPSHCGRQVDWR